MEFQEIKTYAEECLRDTPPPCVSACPLGVDVRGLVSKVRAGRLDAAYRAYREAVLFPRVVSAFCEAPCKAACVRGRLSDGFVDLPSIEREVVAGASGREGSRYAIRKRPERVAVLGAGLSGLACAWRLASKGYAVTVFGSNGGGGITGRDNGDGSLGDNGDGSLCLAMARQREPSPLSPREPSPLSRPLSFDVSQTTFEAALAADREDLFRYVDCEWNDAGAPETLALHENEVFDAVYDMAGETSILGEAGPAEQIARGLSASAAIEERFRIGELSGARDGGRDKGDGRDNGRDNGDGSGPDNGDGSLCLVSSETRQREPSPLSGPEPSPLSRPLSRPSPLSRKIDERFYDLKYDFGEAGEAASEAERCPMCNCSVCIDVCPMIRWFKQNPKRMAADLGVSVLPVGGKIMRVASRLMNSCNLCGLCTAVCPVGVDTCTAIAESRRILKESGHMAPAYHDFWMEDFAHSMSDEAYGVVSSGVPAQIMFFPGCQLAASLPGTVSKTFDFICEKLPNAAMLLGCCGIPADWASEREVFAETAAKLRADWDRLGRPEILFACSACKRTFEKALPEVRGRLVYEWLAEHVNDGNFDEEAIRGLRAAVYDPCNSRDDSFGQAAVRTLAENCGYSLEELALSGEDAACCGFGGHIYPGAPKLLEAILDERSEDLPGVLRLTYCANCRDLFLHRGIDSMHILEALFGDGSGQDNGDGSLCLVSEEARQREPSPLSCLSLPTLSERRENRRLLKTRYADSAAAGIADDADGDSGDKDNGGQDNGDGSRQDNGDGSLCLAVARQREPSPLSCREPSPLSCPSLSMSPEIEMKLDRLLLLREDVEKTVSYCERSGEKAIDPVSGHTIGAFRERLLTVWVEYEIEADGRVAVYNAYTHRMKIEG